MLVDERGQSKSPANWSGVCPQRRGEAPRVFAELLEENRDCRPGSGQSARNARDGVRSLTACGLCHGQSLEFSPLLPKNKLRRLQVASRVAEIGESTHGTENVRCD